jgi:hypothetical protein
MAGRLTLLPNNLLGDTGNALATAPTPAGADTTGALGSTVWGANAGVQFVNNGQVYIWYYNGAAASVAYLLIGQKTEGQLPLFSTIAVTIAATSYGHIGPWSPRNYGQVDPAVHSGSPGGAVGATAIGLMCVDFTVTTNLFVRLYQLSPIFP